MFRMIPGTVELPMACRAFRIPPATPCFCAMAGPCATSRAYRSAEGIEGVLVSPVTLCGGFGEPPATPEDTRGAGGSDVWPVASKPVTLRGDGAGVAEMPVMDLGAAPTPKSRVPETERGDSSSSGSFSFFSSSSSCSISSTSGSYATGYHLIEHRLESRLQPRTVLH